MSSEMYYQIMESGGFTAIQREASRKSTKRLGRLSRRDEVTAVKRSMKFWGLNPNRSKYHQMFWDNVLDATKGFVNGTGPGALLGEFKCTSAVLPPGDPGSAVRSICEWEINVMVRAVKNGRFKEVRDQLAALNPSLPSIPPFFWDQEKGLMDRKEEFLRCTSEQLDPLSRFYPYDGDVEEILRDQYLGTSDSCSRSCTAMVLRAVVIRFACSKGTKCMSCGTAGSLLWNKDKYTSCWSKMKCNVCDSLYEVKTMGDLSENLEKKSIDGTGLFGRFHQIKRTSSNSKLFLAMIGSHLGLKQMVYVAEIEGVVPFLKDRSFLSHVPPRIFSKTFIKDPHPWFALPQQGLVLPPPQILVRHVIDDYSFEAKPASMTAPKAKHEQQVANEGFKCHRLMLHAMTSNEQRAHLRTLKRKRMRIHQLKGRETTSDVSQEDAELLKSRDQIQSEIEFLESIL